MRNFESVGKIRENREKWGKCLTKLSNKASFSFVSASESGQPDKPLLDWVLSRFPNAPRTRVKQWILSGRVSVAGAVIRKPHQVLADPGTELQLLGRQAATLECASAWSIHPRVEILYLDASLAILNKGAGLVAVPAPNTKLSALSILSDFLAGRLKASPRGEPSRVLPPAYRGLEPLPVHRLDQYTSGVFCVALNSQARAHLIEQLKTHTMSRQYIAFVEGKLAAAQGTWRDWLRPSQDELRQHVVLSPGVRNAGGEAVEAITHYEVLREYRLGGSGHEVSKLRLQLETGRKHQIRVQAAGAGHPLIGDRTYNPNYRGKGTVNVAIEFSRQALHAEALELEHPERSGTRLRWTAPFPHDLQQLESVLRKARQ
jgi:23S rRNA pseudouridine1911/1915/1917 synthase